MKICNSWECSAKSKCSAVVVKILKNTCAESKGSIVQSSSVQNPSIHSFKVQSSRIQASRVQASRVQESMDPESKRPESRRPDHASRSSFSGMSLCTVCKNHTFPISYLVFACLLFFRYELRYMKTSVLQQRAKFLPQFLPSQIYINVWCKMKQK